MTTTKMKSKPTAGDKSKRKPAKSVGNGVRRPADVLTLSEAAAYLRVSASEVLRLVGPAGLPGRKIGKEWRFLKSALQEWLGKPSPRSSKEALLSMVGAWKDDPDLDQLLADIYRGRGRPMTEAGQ